MASGIKPAPASSLKKKKVRQNIDGIGSPVPSDDAVAEWSESAPGKRKLQNCGGGASQKKKTAKATGSLSGGALPQDGSDGASQKKKTGRATGSQTGGALPQDGSDGASQKKKTERATGSQTGGALHPFVHDPADDCETCFQAYQDICPFLTKLAQRLGKSKQELCIWDPYYCAGKVKDFYAIAGTEAAPPFDVLLTSPPYSRDHIQKCMEFAVNSGKAWFILQPQYVHRKAYYSPLVSAQDPLFMVPGREYVYYAHHGGRKDNTRVPCRHWERDGKCPMGDGCAFFHGSASEATGAELADPQPDCKDLVPITPFKSIWHIHMGENAGGKKCGRGSDTLNDKTYTWAVQKLKKTSNRLFRTAADLPQDKAFIAHRTWTNKRSH